MKLRRKFGKIMFDKICTEFEEFPRFSNNSGKYLRMETSKKKLQRKFSEKLEKNPWNLNNLDYLWKNFKETDKNFLKIGRKFIVN